MHLRCFILTNFGDYMVDFSDELSQIRTARTAQKRKRFYKSRLDNYKFELLKLHEQGASLGDLQFFLTQKRIKVVASTIHRWLKNNV